jgi:hypothetical protein
MKILFFTFFAFIFLNTYVIAELKDCSQFKKLSKDYLICTKDNLKFKGEDTTISEKVKDFSESKTLADFFFKKKDK